MSNFYNYDTRGASYSDQIIWLEDRVKALEEEIEYLRKEDQEHRQAQAAIYTALNTTEPDRDKWPAVIEEMRFENELNEQRYIEYRNECEQLREDADRWQWVKDNYTSLGLVIGKSLKFVTGNQIESVVDAGRRKNG